MEISYVFVLLIAILILILIYCIAKLFGFKMEKQEFTTKKITGAAILSAVEIVFIVISNYITIGPVNLNLSLVPIALGAMLYGPLVGGFLGLINGAITLLSPSTIAVFMPINPWGTVIVCLLKTCLAGVISGFIFRLFKKHTFAGSLVSSILVPIINTGLFTLGCYAFFQAWLESGTSGLGYGSSFMFLIYAVLGWNFIIEVAISLFLSSTIYTIIKIVKRRVY